jgi:hypothetical protein
MAHVFGSKIAVIDTENDSASRYWDKPYPWDLDGPRMKFDRVNLNPPYSPERYIALMKAAFEEGYDVIIIDSTTHEWSGEGGILHSVDGESNSAAGWKKNSPRHTRFLEAIIRCPVHLICTVRFKDQYVMEQNEKGKWAPRKIGVGAIQREQFEYEFDLMGTVDENHEITFGKSRFYSMSDRKFKTGSDLIEGFKELKLDLDRGILKASDNDLKRLAAVAAGNEIPNESVIKYIATNYDGRTARDLKTTEIQAVIEGILETNANKD